MSAPEEAYEAAKTAFRGNLGYAAPPWPNTALEVRFHRATDAVWALAETQIRAKVAAEIRQRTAVVVDRAEAHANVPYSGAADAHPFVLGAEWAANIAETGGES